MKVVLGLTLASGLAAAEPVLQLDHEPPHLRMRPRAAAVTPVVKAAPTTPIVHAPVAEATGDYDELGGVRDLRQPISASINIGYQVEAANPSGNPSLGGKTPVDNLDYAQLRSYGFAEGFFSTRGVGVESLSTYLSVRAEAANQLVTPSGATVPPPIATWFERSGSDIRTGWAELKDFLPAGWGMQNVRVRAGDQFVYGPWVMHIDGLLAAWDGKILSGSIYTGVRHSDYTRDQPEDAPSIFGASGRFDLRNLPASLPLAFVADYLKFGVNDSGGQPASTSVQEEVDWRPRRDFALIGTLRQLDGNTASAHAQFRGRYKQVTQLVADYTRRYKDDWRWDPSLIVPETDPTQARRYLDLGPVQPQSITSVRAGTLIAENIDLFARGAIARDLNTDPTVASTYNASYTEEAGAFELRLRRTIAIGGSVLSRQTERLTLDPMVDLRNGVAQPLPASAQTGETGFTEVGSSVRMSIGARRFSAMVEVYARDTHYAPIYIDPITPVPHVDIRGGGRFTVDAWIGQHIRLFAAYDLSSALDFAPEITGYKSLRLMMSGVY